MIYYKPKGWLYFAMPKIDEPKKPNILDSIDPKIRALFALLPNVGEVFSIQDRAHWLGMADSIFRRSNANPKADEALSIRIIERESK